MYKNMAKTTFTSTLAVLVLVPLLLVGFCANATIEDDKQALLGFLRNISHSHNLNWSKNSSVCDKWTGIACDANHTRVVGIHLPGVGFRGPIPPNTLGRLSSLQVLSLRMNKISGSFPPDFENLAELTSIYIQSNEFSGPLPSNFSAWKNLTTVDFSNNRFNGSIPSTIANLMQLVSLNLSKNSLTGQIPDLSNPRLEELDLANNNLTGTIPRSLWRFPGWAFSGNNLAPSIAVPPSLPVIPPEPQPMPVKKAKKFGESAVLATVVGACGLAFVLIALIIMYIFRSNRTRQTRTQTRAKVNKEKKVKESSSKRDISDSQQDKTNRLFFFEGCNLAFDLEDLLRASAEVLGKGTFGTTYKAALEDATTTLVVKRLKEVTVPKREFEQVMESVGNVRHDNVVPLRAYYYSKDEKLIVYDYYEQGNISTLLHGGRGQGRVPLDWETRVRIALGAARGIAHIQMQNNGKLVHGNIKASNIFLNSSGHGTVSDAGLAALINPTPPPVARASGYRAPEVTDTRKSTAAADVYSLGVLILELLTGKSPVAAAAGGTEEAVHLVRWVTSVVREEWTAEVFDVELLRYPNIEEEMVEMLQLGMSCVARVPEKRPKIDAVVSSLEEISRAGNRGSSDFSTPVPTPDVAVVTDK